MKCPYCAREIERDAFACPHCGRAVATTKPTESTVEKESDIQGESEKHYDDDISMATNIPVESTAETESDIQEEWEKYSDKGRGLEITARSIPQNRVYYPGDLVQTIVTINSTKNFSVKDITASLGRYQPPGQPLLNRITGLPLIGSSLIGGTTPVVTQVLRKGGKLSAGASESYKVEIRIPDDVIPPYSGGRASTIAYFIWVSEAPHFEYSANILSPIKVGVPPPSRNFDPFTRTISGKTTEMILDLPRLHWVQGEKIRGKIMVRPLKPNCGPINVQARLSLEVDKGGNSTPFLEDIESKTLDNKVAIPFGKAAEYDFEFAIPTDLPPTLKSPIYSVEWELHVFAGTGIFSNASYSQVIQVYSVPFRERQVSHPAQASVEKDTLSNHESVPSHEANQSVAPSTTPAPKISPEQKKKAGCWVWPAIVMGGLLSIAGFCLGVIIVYGQIAGAYEDTVTLGTLFGSMGCFSLSPLIVGLSLLGVGIFALRKSNKQSPEITESTSPTDGNV